MRAPFCIWSQFYNTEEPEEAILEFEKDGIEYIELSSEHITALMKREGKPEDIGEDFASFCLHHGIKIRQAHLIFPSDIVDDPDVDDRIVKQLRMLSHMGVRAAVLHADHIKRESKEDEPSEDEKLRLNTEALKRLAPKIEGFGISVCIENLVGIFRSIDDILSAIEQTKSSVFGICLDTGHLNLTKTSSHREFILKAGDKLKALHIADNDGSSDQHLAPFGRGSVNFFEVVEALREIGYDGMFNHEIGGDSGACPVPVKHFKYRSVKAGYDYLMGYLK